MGLNIRPMNEDDWSEIVEIYFQGIMSNMATFEISCPSYEAWDKSHLSVCRLVAELDYEVVGWAALLPFSSRECYSGVAELSIYIDANHKRQGIGQALLLALIEESERAGFWSLQSVIIQENIPSLKLHEKCGFRQVGYRERLAKDRFGAWRSVIIMERRIQSDIAGGCDCDMVKNGGGN